MEADKLIRIAITAPDIRHDENDVITSLANNGWHMIHLRHPAASLREMRNLIESIPQQFHHKLRLHGHFELINEFNLGGLHLNSRCPLAPPLYTGPVSRSCHSIAEIADCTDCDYVTLSPVFDSISKSGYKATFTPSDLRELDRISHPAVIAMGGITPQHVKELKRFNFAGYAVLGAIMLRDDYNDAILQFNDIN